MRRSNYVHKCDIGRFKGLCRLVKIGKVIEDELVSNPDGIELPQNLGILKIVGFIPTQPLRKKGIVNKSGDPIYYTNEDTDGYVYKVKWNKYTKGFVRKRGIKDKKGLIFKPNHRLRQLIINKLKEDPYFFHRTM